VVVELTSVSNERDGGARGVVVELTSVSNDRWWCCGAGDAG